MSETESTIQIRPGTAADVPALLDLWLRSVRATHAFLREEDIAFYHPLVRQALAGGFCCVITGNGGVPAGFMLLDGNMVEALFIDPDARGKGLGTRLLDKAWELQQPGTKLRVDVNEQNPAALAFYLARGFRRIGRSETDAAGKPFPLIHLEAANPDANKT